MLEEFVGVKSGGKRLNLPWSWFEEVMACDDISTSVKESSTRIRDPSHNIT